MSKKLHELRKNRLTLHARMSFGAVACLLTLGMASTRAHALDLLRQRNCNFREVKVLDGNIGYMKFDMIHDDEEAIEITVKALADVAGCSALIFDLRDNIGGEMGYGQDDPRLSPTQ